jgi:aspartyl/asparaginyl beta-hydroxylase (cupin superfamily)
MAANDDERIRHLVESAAYAFANGRAHDGDRLLRQAETEAPEHPLVLNEVARRRLLAGDAAGAREVLDQAVKTDPANPALWLHLAAALRSLGRADEERFALDKVLEIEPNHVRGLLQAASLYEIQGDPRTAAATYRRALKLIPPGLDIPAEMRPVLEHATQAVEANNHALEAFLEDRLKDLRVRYSGEPLGRFDRSLATLLQKRRVYRPQPTFMYVPQLPAIEFYEHGDFPWLESIEAASDEIRAELRGVLADGPTALDPYISVGQGTPDGGWRELNNSRRWGVFYLWREGVARPENIARCPRTVAALEAWPRCELPGCAPTAMFSILDAKTRIPAHTGVNNARLVVHLPLIVPPGCGFRVGAETREWRPGEAFVFDDTIEHEAWNDSDDARAVLIFDIWNPHLTLAERDMVCALTAGVGEFYGALPEYI